jgi:hypothetical protein
MRVASWFGIGYFLSATWQPICNYMIRNILVIRNCVTNATPQVFAVAETLRFALGCMMAKCPTSDCF